MSEQATGNSATIGSALAGKYLTFALENEIYGLDILKVQEIIGMMEVTRVPRAPAYVRGVVNLRGKVIPVVDLRTKFGMGVQEDTVRTCIVVVQANTANGELTVGGIVDEVSEVVDIGQGEIEPTPSLAGGGGEESFVTAIGKVEGKMVMLLDANKVFASDELNAAMAAAV